LVCRRHIIGDLCKNILWNQELWWKSSIFDVWWWSWIGHYWKSVGNSEKVWCQGNFFLYWKENWAK
jgi:hypothetical protein